MIGQTILPDNTPQNPQDIGKEVKLKEGWASQNISYIDTNSGVEIKEIIKVATVYAISVGNGQTVPVPKGFWYVGGTLEDGVIISDKEEDKFDGIVDKTTHEYAINLVGNQFVWIPCDVKEYKKTTTFTKATSDSTWGTKSQNAYYDTITNDAEITQIEKYGGFYIARYEAGTSNIKGIDFANITTTGWTTDATNYAKVTSGKITSKANEIPYYHASYVTAVEMSKSMYKDDIQRNQYVNSGLVTGTMWDVMLNKLQEKTGCDLAASNFGNYSNAPITGCRGQHCEVNSSGGHGSWVIAENYTKNNATMAILSTASSDFTQKMHLYDIAGNLWEWNMEMAFNNNNAEWFMLRGGSFGNSYSVCPASFRGYDTKNNTRTNAGFRVALYIK